MELEKIFELKVGQLRELLAYEDADDTVGDVWDCVDEAILERVGFYSDDDCDSSYYDDNYDEDTAYDEDDELYDDEDYEDEEEEDPDYLDSDEVCIGGALADPAMEEIAQEISYDIVQGRYSLEAVTGIYSEDIINRIMELADLDRE